MYTLSHLGLPAAPARITLQPLILCVQVLGKLQGNKERVEAGQKEEGREGHAWEGFAEDEQ